MYVDDFPEAEQDTSDTITDGGIDIFPPTSCNEQLLWRNVILQAIIDASMDKTKSKKETFLYKNALRLSQDAKNWIIDDPDFLQVCRFANLPPITTRFKLLEFLTNPHSKTLPELRHHIFEYEANKRKLISEEFL